MHVEPGRDSPAMHIRVPERLEIATVEDIEGWLRHSHPERHVVLEFQETCSFDVQALWRLACMLSRTEWRVVLRGLPARPYRLIRDAPRRAGQSSKSTPSPSAR